LKTPVTNKKGKSRDSKRDPPTVDQIGKGTNARGPRNSLEKTRNSQNLASQAVNDNFSFNNSQNMPFEDRSQARAERTEDQTPILYQGLQEKKQENASTLLLDN